MQTRQNPKKPHTEITEALETLIKHKVEVIFLYMDSQYYIKFKGKKNWRVFSHNVPLGLRLKAVKETPYFIKYRCQKIANQN